MRHHKKSIIKYPLATICLLFGLLVGLYIERRQPATSGNIQAPLSSVIGPVDPRGEIAENFTPSSAEPSSQPQLNLPKNLNYTVPFTIQSPDSTWTGIYKEACEEASLLMASEYFKGNRTERMNVNYATEEIQKLADWEDRELGYNLDINSLETAQVATQALGLKAEIINSFTENELKKYLYEGKLILLPADGRLLKNPNFRSPGPPYHMLVIKGYNEQGFITNDPGTRNGKDYFYTFDTLYEANGDWSHANQKVNTGNKTAIVVWK